MLSSFLIHKHKEVTMIHGNYTLGVWHSETRGVCQREREKPDENTLV